MEDGHRCFTGCCWHQPTDKKHGFLDYPMIDYIDE